MRFLAFLSVVAVLLLTLTLAAPLALLPTTTNALAVALPPSTAHPLAPRSTNSFLPSPPAPPFPHGRCGIHVTQKQQWQGFRPDAPVGSLRVVVRNSRGEVIHTLPWTKYEPRENVTFFSGVPVAGEGNEPSIGEDGKEGLVEDDKGGMERGRIGEKGKEEPRQMWMTLHAGTDVFFRIGDDSWLSSDARCKVGAWDRIRIYFWDLKQPIRDMDCGFAC